MRKLGIVFSGGGIRGMAHVGLIDALREEGIEFDLIAGTSAGALVGALYANGYRSEEMLEAFSSVPLFSVNNFTFRKPGLIDTLRLRKFIRKYLPENSFESLKKQLFINSVNLEKGKSVAHSSGKLYRPLLASMSLPPYFSPVKIDGQLHADGGIMNNFPVELIRKQCDVVIGSYVCPLEKSGNNSLNNTLSVWWRAYTLNFYAISKSKFQQCDYVFEPYDLCEIGTLDTKSIERAYQIGYETAKEEMKFLLEAIYAQSAKRLNMAMAA